MGIVFAVAAAAALLALFALRVQATPELARKRIAAITSLLGLLAVASLASGCVNVKAWQRGRMASLCMSRGPDVEEAMIERTFLESREGASGGSAASAGGGCACN